jgi:MFS family permease
MIKKVNAVIEGLLFSNGLILIAGAMLGPIYAIFVDEVGGDILDAGIAFGVFSIVAFFTTIFSGIYLDKKGKNSTMIIIGYLMLAIGFASYIFVKDMRGLLMVQVVIGIAEAIYAPAFDGLFTDYIDDGKQNMEWGLWEGMDYMTKAVGAMMGAVVAKYFGFDMLFVIMSMFCVMGAIYVFHHKVNYEGN